MNPFVVQNGQVANGPAGASRLEGGSPEPQDGKADGSRGKLSLKGNQMTELRQRVERGSYRVDPSLVAGSMLTKMMVVNRVRRRLQLEADRSPGQLGLQR